MLDGYWQSLTEATRTRLKAARWPALWALGVLFVVTWGWFGQPSPKKSQPHDSEQHCTYTGQPRGVAHKSSNSGPVVVCFQTSPVGSTPKTEIESGERPRDLLTLSQLIAWKLISDPVALFTAVLALFTWRLIVVGRDQHSVAIRAIKSSEDSSRREIRAYLSVEIQGMAPVGANQTPTAKISTTNVGQTPAYNVRTAIEVLMLQDSITAVQVPDGTEMPKVGTTIGPGRGQTTGSTRYGLLKSAYDEYAAGDLRFAVVGTVIYEDIFGETHHTRFFHLYTHDDPGGSYHTYGNNAD